jgi:hypothetical protein
MGRNLPREKKMYRPLWERRRVRSLEDSVIGYQLYLVNGNKKY